MKKLSVFFSQKKIALKLIGYCIFLLFLHVDLVYGQTADTPWPMFQHDSRHTGRSSFNASDQLRLKWTFAAGGWVFSSPAIGSDGTIYVGSLDSNLYAINADSTLKWSFHTGGQIITSPAVGIDGTIYVGSEDHRLYALNPQGTLKWQFIANKWIGSSPAIDIDGTIYVGSGDSTLYAINSDGNLKWEFYANDRVDSSPAIGLDGTIYVGSFDNKLYAINSDGTLKWQFITNGAVKSSPSIALDGTIYVGSEDNNLYAINSDSTLKWTFTTGYLIDSSPAIGSDGTIYVGSLDGKLYAINPDGTLKWEFNTGDIVVSSPIIDIDGTIYVGSGAMSLPDSRFYAINPDGTLKWEFNTGSTVGRSAAIGLDGTLYIGGGNNLYAIGPQLAPSVSSINDIPGDQGKQVRIIWNRSGLDILGSEQPITAYGIWRRMDDLSSVKYNKKESLRDKDQIKSARVVNNFKEMLNDFHYLTPGTRYIVDQNELWDFVGSVTAIQFEQYAFVAPTLFDSTETGIVWSVFFISAHTDNPLIWFASEPDSGYSVDNLAPSAPTGLYGVADSNGIELNWNDSIEKDFYFYTVYRDTIPNFELNEPLAFSTDTSFMDILVEVGRTYYYKVTATDFAGNESIPSNELEITYQPTSVGVVSILPIKYVIAQNYPNPFNSETIIRYQLPASGKVRLVIYNTLGQIIRILVNDYQIPGYYNIKWNGKNRAGFQVPSGIYLYRLRAGNFVETRKMSLIR